MAFTMTMTLTISDDDVADIKKKWDLSEDEFLSAMADFKEEIETTPTQILDSLDYFNC